MFSRFPHRRSPFGGGFSAGGGGAPRDVVVLIGVLFLTYTFRFFETTAALPGLMQLSAAVWQVGYLWQLFTYPFAGYGLQPSVWFLLELLILFWFGRDVFFRLGRRAFWQLVGWAAVPAALVAVATDALGRLLAGGASLASFHLMQGQRMLLAVAIVAFATMNRNATIYLFFVLPIQARWFIPLPILFAFLGFLATRDLAGFLGLCAGVGMTWGLLQPGGLQRGARELWLRAQQRWMRYRLDRLRRKRGFRVVRGEKGPRGPDDRDPWVH